MEKKQSNAIERDIFNMDEPFQPIPYQDTVSGNVQSDTSGAGCEPLSLVTPTDPVPVQEQGITSLTQIEDDLRQLTAQPIETVPSEPSEPPGLIGVSAKEFLLHPIKSIPFLVESLLQKVGIACIAGSSDTGKSSFLRHLCMCIVSGRSDFLGFKINSEHRRAIYVSTEDDVDTVNTSINMQNENLQVELSQLEGLRCECNTENLIKRLDTSMTIQPVDIVCIDAFTDLYGKQLNESNQVRTYLTEYSQLAGKHKCLILFLHHTCKRTDDLAPSKDNLLGSQGIESKMRLVMILKTDMIDRSLKHLCIVKGNYLPSEAKNESYQLRFTENTTFENTGVRVPFEALVKGEEYEGRKHKKQEEDRQKYERIQEYLSKGYSLDEIAPLVDYSGKSGVSGFLTRYRRSHQIQ
jgi:hypothetical protein